MFSPPKCKSSFVTIYLTASPFTSPLNLFPLVTIIPLFVSMSFHLFNFLFAHLLLSIHISHMGKITRLLTLSDLVQVARYSQDPTTLLQMAVFHLLCLSLSCFFSYQFVSLLCFVRPSIRFS